MAIDHAERDADGHRGVDGVAAILQDLEPGPCGERMHRSDRAVRPMRHVFRARIAGQGRETNAHVP